jgi:hypothetical protein
LLLPRQLPSCDRSMSLSIGHSTEIPSNSLLSQNAVNGRGADWCRSGMHNCVILDLCHQAKILSAPTYARVGSGLRPIRSIINWVRALSKQSFHLGAVGSYASPMASSLIQMLPCSQSPPSILSIVQNFIQILLSTSFTSACPG